MSTATKKSKQKPLMDDLEEPVSDELQAIAEKYDGLHGSRLKVQENEAVVKAEVIEKMAEEGVTRLSLDGDRYLEIKDKRGLTIKKKAAAGGQEDKDVDDE